MPSQWVIAPSWSGVSHTGSKEHPFLPAWWCSSLSLLRLPVWSFHCLVAWISISMLFIPICISPWGPKCWCTFGTFWHCLLRVCSQCCQCGSRQLLTQSVSPSEPWLPAHQSQDTRVFVSVSALLSASLDTGWWVLSCWPTQKTWRSALWSNYLIWAITCRCSLKWRFLQAVTEFWYSSFPGS